MKEQGTWRGEPNMHPSTFIQDEMDARHWTRDMLAVAMAQAGGGDIGIMRLELDLYFTVGPNDDRLRIGRTATAIERAFDLSEGFFARLEAAWLMARKAVE